MNQDKETLKVTVFSDYICPFCYVGDARLDKLREKYELDVDWVFFEIHPDNPPEGKPVSELGYPPAQWERMMSSLEAMAKAENLPLAPRTFTTNSHRALLLAEAAKDSGEDTFNALHKRLFEAYFVERKNIGDPEVLKEIAADVGISGEFVSDAWRNEDLERRLKDQQMRSAMLGVQGVPAYLFGKYFVSGAVPVDTLLTAAEYALGKNSAEDAIQ
ncbi:MAG TPA: DsbA family oxidoreductase [Gammaproteobacteria bacterium]